MSNSKLEVFLIVLPIFIGSLTLHELAHGYVAYRLGDPTAKLLGRLSLNPIVHLDPLGSLMFVASYWAGGFLFGWAKPVPVDPRNLRGGPQRGMALVGIAGPITNFLLAVVFGALLAHTTYTGTAQQVIVYGMYVNIVLGVFNLLPIPPLDGSRIVAGFMDRQTYAAWSSLDQYGMIFLLVLFFVFQGQFTTLLQHSTTDVSTLISEHRRGPAVQPVRLVTFDGDDTLWALEPIVEGALADACQAFAEAFPDAPVSREELLADRLAVQDQLPPGTDLREYRRAAYRRRVDLLGGGPDALVDQLAARFHRLRSSLIEPYPDALAALERLVGELAARLHHERQRRRRGHPVRGALRLPAARARARAEQARHRDVRRRPRAQRRPGPRGRARRRLARLRRGGRAGGRLPRGLAEPRRPAERDVRPARRRDRVARRARRGGRGPRTLADVTLDLAVVRQNVADARGAIDAAAARAGRAAGTVELLAATKYVAPEDMPLLAEAGIELVGENRTDALAAKQALHLDRFTWDFIGALQSRKARDVVDRVRLVHAVESLSAAEQLARRAEGDVACLIEVGVAGESQKAGVAPDQLDAFLEACAPLERLRVEGLMTMPPLAGGSRGVSRALRSPPRARLRRSSPAGPDASRSGASRWGHRRISRSPWRRARPSSDSVPSCTADRQGRLPRHGRWRYVASGPRLLRIGRG